MSEIAILGGGPAGLIAALRARQRGHNVTVFEASSVVGGMAASFEEAGQRVDLGSHRLHPATDPETLSLIGSLLGVDLQERRRNGRIRLRDRWIAFPLQTKDMLRNLPLSFSSKAAFDTLAKPFRSNSNKDFESEIRHRLGPTVVNEFYGPYSRKLYGVEPSQLTTELSDRRVSASSAWTVLRNAVRTSQSDTRIFFYPKRGYGQIAETLADAAVAEGVEIRLHSAVEQLVVGDADVQIVTSSGSTDARTVLSSIPLTSLANALDPPPSPAVRQAIADQRTRGMLLVYLVVPRTQYTPFDAHYFPSTELSTARLSESKNYRSGDDPEEISVLCAEIPCWVGSELWNADIETLSDIVEEDLARAGLPVTDRVHGEVRYLPSVYPVYEHSTLQDRVTIDNWARKATRVVTLGRQGLGVPDNLHHVLAMGAKAASAIGPSGDIDQSAWQDSLDDFANHVVQD